MSNPKGTAPAGADDPLQDVSVLNDEGLLFGLPSFLFVGGIVLTAAFLFFFRSVWWVAVLFGFVYFTAMYGIHANDPKGAKGWVRAVRRPSTWSGGKTRSRRISYLEEKE